MIKKKITAWSAGCSTGEEPYTLSLVLHNYFKDMSGWDIKILASDINTEALENARKGIYSYQEVKNIPYNYLKTYFKMGTGSNQGLFKVKEVLQRPVEFKKINLASLGQQSLPGPFSIIFCRNVFIYFDHQLRAKVLRQFYQNLMPGGLLFVGHSESVDTSNQSLGKWRMVKHTIYEKLEQ